jgi:hypothetical protein
MEQFPFRNRLFIQQSSGKIINKSNWFSLPLAQSSRDLFTMRFRLRKRQCFDKQSYEKFFIFIDPFLFSVEK